MQTWANWMHLVRVGRARNKTLEQNLICITHETIYSRKFKIYMS